MSICTAHQTAVQLNATEEFLTDVDYGYMRSDRQRKKTGTVSS